MIISSSVGAGNDELVQKRELPRQISADALRRIVQLPPSAPEHRFVLSEGGLFVVVRMLHDDTISK